MATPEVRDILGTRGVSSPIGDLCCQPRAAGEMPSGMAIAAPARASGPPGGQHPGCRGAVGRDLATTEIADVLARPPSKLAEEAGLIDDGTERFSRRHGCSAPTSGRLRCCRTAAGAFSSFSASAAASTCSASSSPSCNLFRAGPATSTVARVLRATRSKSKPGAKTGFRANPTIRWPAGQWQLRGMKSGSNGDR